MLRRCGRGGEQVKLTEGKKKLLKYGLNILFILLITGFALYFIFRDNDPATIWKQVRSAKGSYVLVGVALMVIFVCSESCIMRYLFGGLKAKMTIGKCLLLSNIGFFFSAITPGASGGQPLQIFYMMKCGVDSLVSTLVAMVITVVYKFTLVILCVAFFILAPDVTQNAINEVPILFIIGCVMQIGFMVFLLICIYQPKIAAFIVRLAVKLGGKIRLVKKPDELLGKAMDSVRQYEQAAKYIREHIHVLFVSLGITIIQRLAYFSVTFMVAKALSIDCSWVEVVAIQIVISLSVDALPLPGATGVTEGVFIILQAMMLGQENVATCLLLNRGITYYALALVTGVFTLIGHLYFCRISKMRAEALKQVKDSDGQNT